MRVDTENFDAGLFVASNYFGVVPMFLVPVPKTPLESVG